jgi:hypothetical protein
MKANFDLIPFATDTAPAIEITGAIERQDNQLTIEYKLVSQLKKRSRSPKGLAPEGASVEGVQSPKAWQSQSRSVSQEKPPTEKNNVLPIIIPPLDLKPIRQKNLWEHTCCEIFLGLPNSTQYWEFNLSPTGNWNVYHLLDYRQNLTEESAFSALPFQVSQKEDSWQLQLTVDLHKIISAKQNLIVGVTAVIEDRANQLSYWALSHPGKHPDFHHRDAFILEL